MRHLRLLTSLMLSFLPVLTSAQIITTAADDTKLRQIIIFGRHGVRSPVASEEMLASFTARKYPKFNVLPGYLTQHGAAAARILGTYWRDYLLHEGLLTGNSAADGQRAYFRANSIERSIATAAAMAAGVYPGTSVPVRSFPLGQPDALFDPIAAKVVRVDGARAAREVSGILGNGTAIKAAYASEFDLIRGVLQSHAAPGAPLAEGTSRDPTALPIPLVPNPNAVTNTVIETGAVLATLLAADPFVMEYAEGLPPQDVAWGELSRDALSQQTRIINLLFDIETLPPYLNRLQSSNAAAHILRSLQQAASGKRVAGAMGEVGTNVIVVNSSDAYVIGLAGLMGLHWLLQGYQPDYCAPDGAIVLELRQSVITRKYFVRGFYTAQTLDQLRELTPLGLDRPPATMQLLLPGAHRPSESLDVPFSDFTAAVNAAIDQHAVQNPTRERLPPSVAEVRESQ